jgi:hypothetical protein
MSLRLIPALFQCGSLRDCLLVCMLHIHAASGLYKLIEYFVNFILFINFKTPSFRQAPECPLRYTAWILGGWCLLADSS